MIIEFSVRLNKYTRPQINMSMFDKCKTEQEALDLLMAYLNSLYEPYKVDISDQKIFFDALKSYKRWK
jgi:hypothetical protein